MKNELKTKKELIQYVDNEMNDYKKNHQYWFKGGKSFQKGSEHYRFFQDFVKDVSSHILDKTSAKLIKDTSTHSTSFHFEFPITANQNAGFWFNYSGPIDGALLTGLNLSLKYKPKVDFDSRKDIPKDFLKTAITSKISNKGIIKNARNYSNVDSCEGDHLLRISSDFDHEIEKYYPEVKQMLENNPQELTDAFRNYFDNIYGQFKPLADSLEANLENFPSIFEEKAKADLEYKTKIGEISDKLFGEGKQ